MVIKMPTHLSAVYPGNVLFADSIQGETRAQIFEIDQPEKLQTKTQITKVFPFLQTPCISTEGVTSN